MLLLLLLVYGDPKYKRTERYRLKNYLKMKKDHFNKSLLRLRRKTCANTYAMVNNQTVQQWLSSVIFTPTTCEMKK